MTVSVHIDESAHQRLRRTCEQIPQQPYWLNLCIKSNLSALGPR